MSNYSAFDIENIELILKTEPYTSFRRLVHPIFEKHRAYCSALIKVADKNRIERTSYNLTNGKSSGHNKAAGNEITARLMQTLYLLQSLESKNLILVINDEMQMSSWVLFGNFAQIQPPLESNYITGNHVGFQNKPWHSETDPTLYNLLQKYGATKILPTQALRELEKRDFVSEGRYLHDLSLQKAEARHDAALISQNENSATDRTQASKAQNRQFYAAMGGALLAAFIGGGSAWYTSYKAEIANEKRLNAYKDSNALLVESIEELTQTIKEKDAKQKQNATPSKKIKTLPQATTPPNAS